MMELVSISFDVDNADSDGAPYEVYVQVGEGERRMYQQTAETKLLNYRTSEQPVQIAMCDECGCETYTDDECLYCCMCGAKVVN